MKLHIKIEFPCGYKYEVIGKAFFIDTKGCIPTECPLHEKGCKRLEKSK